MSEKSFLQVSWRVLALSSLLLNLVAIVTVATVATVTDAEALETVALALAILAFICQLIIYSVQTWQSGAQLREARELNTQTLATLAEVQTRMEGTHQMVSVQHQELMHLAALKASSVLRKDAAESTDGRVSVSVAQAAVQAVTVAADEAPTSAVSKRRNRSEPRFWAPPINWPSLEAAERVIAKLHEITINETSLILAVTNDIVADRSGEPRGLVYSEVLDSRLVETGLMLVESGNNPRDKVAVLTDEGREAGRIMAAPLPVPNHLRHHKSYIEEIRNSAFPPEMSMLEREASRLNHE